MKPSAAGERVTRYNALFHWRVPEGREIEAGREVGRHHILTHAYWREGGPEFANVNIMAVAHGTEKQVVLAHKAAIDGHLEEAGIPVTLHERVLGRPQRDQAVRSAPRGVRGVVPSHQASIPTPCARAERGGDPRLQRSPTEDRCGSS